MLSTFLPRSMVILSIRFIDNNSIDISGFSSCGHLEIKLVSHPLSTTMDSLSHGLVSFSRRDDLCLAEDIKNEILELLKEKELSWLRRPFAGSYSMVITHNGRFVLYWRGRDMKKDNP